MSRKNTSHFKILNDTLDLMTLMTHRRCHFASGQVASLFVTRF